MEYLKFCFVFSCWMKFANSVFSTEAPNTPAPIPKGKTAFQTFLFFIFFLLPAVVVVSQLVAAVNLSALSAPLHRSKPPTVVTYSLHTLLSLVIEQFGPRFRTRLCPVWAVCNLPTTSCHSVSNMDRQPRLLLCTCLEITWRSRTQQNRLRFLTILFLFLLVWRPLFTSTHVGFT